MRKIKQDGYGSLSGRKRGQRWPKRKRGGVQLKRSPVGKNDQIHIGKAQQYKMKRLKRRRNTNKEEQGQGAADKLKSLAWRTVQCTDWWWCVKGQLQKGGVGLT